MLYNTTENISSTFNIYQISRCIKNTLKDIYQICRYSNRNLRPIKTQKLLLFPSVCSTHQKLTFSHLLLQKTYHFLNLEFCPEIQSELHTILAQVNNAVMINITSYQKKQYTNRFFNFHSPFVARLKLNRFSSVSSCQTSSDTSKSRRSCTNAFQYFICNYYGLRRVLYLKIYKILPPFFDICYTLSAWNQDQEKKIHNVISCWNVFGLLLYFP